MRETAPSNDTDNHADNGRTALACHLARAAMRVANGEQGSLDPKIPGRDERVGASSKSHHDAKSVVSFQKQKKRTEEREK